MRTIDNLVAEEMAEYKVQVNGNFSSLTSVELLGMVLGKTTTLSLQKARNLLNLTNGNINDISKLTAKQIREVTNFTEQKLNSILAAIELGFRAQTQKENYRDKLESAYEIYQFLKPRISHLDHEEVWVMLMNNSLKLIKTKQLSIGGLTESSFDIRLMLKEALLNNATVIVVSHNHPSGNKKPSREDDRITKKLKEACDTMRIHLLDCVIVTEDGYYSYSEEGKL